MQPNTLMLNLHEGISLHVCFALHEQLLLEYIKSKHTVLDSCGIDNTMAAFPTIVGSVHGYAFIFTQGLYQLLQGLVIMYCSYCQTSFII